MVPLPGPPAGTTHDHYYLQPTAVSGDGSVIISSGAGGDTPRFASIWQADNGTRFLERAMVYEYGLAFEMAGWGGVQPLGTSDDGTTIVGWGLNPQGDVEAWVARLDEPARPHPPGALAAIGIPVTSADVLPSSEMQSFVAGGVTYHQNDLIQPTLAAFAGNRGKTTVQMPVNVAIPGEGERAALLTDDFRLDTGVINPANRPDAATFLFTTPLVNGPGPDLVMFETTAIDKDLFANPFQIEVNGVAGIVTATSWGQELGTVDVSFYNRNGGAPANLSQLETAAFTKSFDTEALPYVGVAIDLTELGVEPFAQVSTVRIGSLGTERSVDPVLFMGIRSAAAALPGDFNTDGTVDAADYIVWRDGLGTTYTQADYNVWRANFGATGALVGTIGVPEPKSIGLAALAFATWSVICGARHPGSPGWTQRLQTRKP
jgi:hypothetical protein